MRILQVMAGAPYGGAEAFFTRLVPALEKSVRIQQRAIIRTHPQRTAALRQNGVDVAEVPFGGRFDFKTSRMLSREIKDFNPDIVVTWMNRASGACPQGDFVHVARLGGYYNLKYYQNCDHLIANTKDIANYLADENWPKERIHYLPNFVSERKLEPVARKDLFTPKDAPLFLALGRLHENKAFDVLLEALARIPEAYLWIAGDGPLRQDLESLAERLSIKPRVRFLGWRDDTEALLAAADIFVCPSRHEPLGNVVLEAWAQEKPVVAADSLGPGTLIEHLKSGFLVPVDDARALSKALIALSGDAELKNALALEGRRSFKKDFTEAAVVERYMQFFEKLVS
jgi:glycosyltransferase involved in cell wall biosynthesis